MAQFQHPNYSLVDDDRIVRNENAPGNPTLNEQGEVLQEIGRYVQAKITTDFGFISLKIPEDDVPASTSVLISPDWQTAAKLLVMTNNASGSMLGIFSRSLCLDAGLSQGSMLPYIQRARDLGYAVLILRPNSNSIVTEVSTNLGSSVLKVPIQGSESPEAHAMYVWENIIPRAECVRHIVLLGYGNGASLCKDVFTRQVVRSQQDETEPNRIKGFIAIEASCILEDDDAGDLKVALRNMVVNMETARADGDAGASPKAPNSVATPCLWAKREVPVRVPALTLTTTPVSM